jgi:hypothetical protein
VRAVASLVKFFLNVGATVMAFLVMLITRIVRSPMGYGEMFRRVVVKKRMTYHMDFLKSDLIFGADTVNSINIFVFLKSLFAFEGCLTSEGSYRCCCIIYLDIQCRFRYIMAIGQSRD